jgi:carboxymethylenebutenolidase
MEGSMWKRSGRRTVSTIVLSLVAVASCEEYTPPSVVVMHDAPVAVAIDAVMAPAGSAPPETGNPLQPALVGFASGALALHGYLYRPLGKGPFPAIVYDHGSAPQPGSMLDQAEFYVKHGYVLFVPHRRGFGQSANAGVPSLLLPASPTDLYAELEAEVDDVMAAVTYLASVPEVDRTRIATVGCGFGGVDALLAAERGQGLVAAIDFAGAAIPWSHSAPLRERMKAAARNAAIPVFFIQAGNDYDTSPSKELSRERAGSNKPVQTHVFPPFGSTPADGHAFCMGGAAPPWGDEVLTFLSSAMGTGR